VPPAEDDLVEAVRRGDRRAFADLVREYQTCVRGFARAFLGDEEGDDVAQETFRNLWSDRAELSPVGSLRGHLLARARNLCLTRARSLRRAEQRLRRLQAEPRDAAATPLERLGEREQAAKQLRQTMFLVDRIRLLPEEARTAVTMRFWEGASFDEIARVLGRPPHAVRALLYRQLALLRQRLDREDS
jgi:RNA polymerase sigma-70 factor, ECF subfamily